MQRVKCIKDFQVEKCDDNGFTIENQYEFIEKDSVWEVEEDSSNRVIGGEVRLIRVENEELVWLEISQDLFKENFVLLENKKITRNRRKESDFMFRALNYNKELVYFTLQEARVLEDLPVNAEIMECTGISDVDGDLIYEDMIVHQKSVLMESPDINFIGYVKMVDGQWCIDDGKEAIPLFNECCETKIIEEI